MGLRTKLKFQTELMAWVRVLVNLFFEAQRCVQRKINNYKISYLAERNVKRLNFYAIFRIYRFDFKKYFLHLSPVTSVLWLSRKRKIEINKSESSSVGRARPCQGRGREFESRLPLNKKMELFLSSFFVSLEWWNW